jgi:NAD+ kinase
MKNIGLFENSTKPEAFKYAEIAAKYLLDQGAECCAGADLLSSFPKELADRIKCLPIEEFDKFADAVISFGGDGTMLTATKTLIKKDLPIMGLNVGNLGFLAEFPINELESSLDNLLCGNYRLVDRAVMETELNGETLYALNDFVIEKMGSSRMVTVSAFANEHLIANYRADGLIIATPTGSTAYSLSCGGPVIAPSTEVICLTPISPHSLTLRPLVLPDIIEIKIKVHSHIGISSLAADGQRSYELANDTAIVIKKSKERIKMIKPLTNSYYDLLRAKLLWSANAIDHEVKEIPNKNGDEE